MLKYKINRKLVTIICDGCGNETTKPESEYKRNVKLNRKMYCSRVCIAKNGNRTRNPNGNYYDISVHTRTKDQFSYFRSYHKTARARFKECNIDLIDLKQQWEKQKGICPYSGVDLLLRTATKSKDSKYIASLDRIESNLGYIKGNIQFVSQAINYMKNTMSHEETIELCKIIAKFHSI